MQSRTAQQFLGDRMLVALVILGVLAVGLIVAVVALSIVDSRSDNATASAVDAPRSVNLPADRVGLSIGGENQAATTNSVNLPADRIALSIGGNIASTKSFNLPADRMRLSVPDASVEEPARYTVPDDRLRVLFGE